MEHILYLVLHMKLILAPAVTRTLREKWAIAGLCMYFGSGLVKQSSFGHDKARSLWHATAAGCINNVIRDDRLQIQMLEGEHIQTHAEGEIHSIKHVMENIAWGMSF